MAASSSFNSPDPLALPSSPLGARSTRHSSVKPLAPRSSNAFSSPSKSSVMETGNAGDASPWRIKVTVEAEPKEGSGSPSKKGRKTKTVSVPVKGLEAGSDPAKNAVAVRKSVYMDGESEIEIKQPQRRKRKGTPIRRRTTRSQSAQDPTTAEDRDDDAVMMPPPTSPATKARRRRSLKDLPVPTQRSKRLSQAREELDHALQEAVGHSNEDEGDEDGDGMGYEVPGDMTVAGEEDFTMVSVETLQSLKGDTSTVSNGRDREQSRLSVSYLPSSPPKQMQDNGDNDAEDEVEPDADEEKAGVRYPNLANEAKEARTTPAAKTYHAMSWKATGVAKEASPDRGRANGQLNSEPIEWQRAREAVSRQIENANPGEVITVDYDTVAGAAEEGNYEAEHVEPGGEHEDDIWQEEASRSLEEVEEQQSHQLASRRPRPQMSTTTTTAQSIGNLFGAEPVRPRRAKIPRTWRRTSGADFAYSDSPAHVEPLEAGKKRDASTDGGGSRASSGVLTPPSTDDEAHRPQENVGQEEEEGDSDISLTRPDAEATRLDHDEPAPAPQREDVDPRLSYSGSEGVSLDGGDTGLFWQMSNPPQVNRPGRRPRPPVKQRAMDLSELLNLNKSSPAKQHHRSDTGAARSSSSVEIPAGSSRVEARQSAVRDRTRHMRPIQRKGRSSPSEASGAKAVSSPLRKSLLRCSKLGGSAVGEAAKSPLERQSDVNYRRNHEEDEESEEVGESFQSKASDQRQLLGETLAQARSGKQAHMLVSEQAAEHYEDDVEDDDYISEHDETAEERDVTEPSHSYEEHLNIESPQKIKVRFGDSLNSSLLAPRREYAPLFEPDARQASSTTSKGQASPPIIALVSSKKSTTTTTSSTQQSQGIFSRVSTSLWSAVVRPSGPAEILPHPATQQERRSLMYSPTLAAQIRSRYGVLRNEHPWSMAHMRTLHRMVNSCSSGKADSIIPKSGPLPEDLSGLIGTRCKSVAGYDWVLTTQHAHVVEAFLQVLVPTHVVQAMDRGDVDMLGDGTARTYRGLIEGRHGEDLVWGAKLVTRQGGSVIDSAFVVQALGDVVAANEGAYQRAVAGREAVRCGLR